MTRILQELNDPRVGQLDLSLGFGCRQKSFELVSRMEQMLEAERYVANICYPVPVSAGDSRSGCSEFIHKPAWLNQSRWEMRVRKETPSPFHSLSCHFSMPPLVIQATVTADGLLAHSHLQRWST